MFAQSVYIDFNVLLTVCLIFLYIAIGIFFIYLAMTLASILKVFKKIEEPLINTVENINKSSLYLPEILDNVEHISGAVARHSDEILVDVSNAVNEVSSLTVESTGLAKDVVVRLRDIVSGNYGGFSKRGILRNVLTGIKVIRRALVLKRKFTKR